MPEVRFRNVIASWLVRAASNSSLASRLQHFPAIYRPLRAALVDLVGRGPVTREIVDGPLRGYRMVLGSDDRNAYLVNAHERPIVNLVCQWCKPGMQVLDVGAHVGYFTLLFAVLVGPKGRVYAVEPKPENLVKLRAMLAANSVANVTVFPVAATDRKGEVEFITERTGQMGHISDGRAPHEDESVIAVEAVRLDDLTRANDISRIDLIKIDIEGTEPEALRGMADLLLHDRPAIICEWHPLVAGPDYTAVFGTLGYACDVLEPSSRTEPFHVLACPRNSGCT